MFDCFKSKSPRVLLAMDFDQTIIKDNSDLAITQVMPGGIPKSIRELYTGENWGEFVNAVFRYVAQQGITIERLKTAIGTLELLPGMERFLRKVSKRQAQNRMHFVVISDCNNFFIETRLSSLKPPVAPTFILSNSAVVSPDGSRLTVQPYEVQRTCSLCPVNLCKGAALEKYRREFGPFERLYYAGDGSNDLCPALRLTNKDTLFVRTGYMLHKILNRPRFRGHDVKIAARVVYFENAKTIGDHGSSSAGARILYAFDFDHTIVDKNSDVAILDLIPDCLPDDIRKFYDGTNWTAYMNEIFKHFHSQDILVEHLKSRIARLEPIPEMNELLTKIFRDCQATTNTEGVRKSDFMVISDANDLFISEFLRTRDPPIQACAILTNTAIISPCGNLLQITPFHYQDSCKLCPRNLCKGRALDEFLEKHGPYDKIFYSGDGRNDLCPALRLRENDVLFVRKGFALEKVLENGTNPVDPRAKVELKSKIVYFDDANVIREEMGL